MEAAALPARAHHASADPEVLPAPSLRLAADAELVARIRRGETGAFEAAYNRHGRPIQSFCQYLLGDPDEAQDAVQHTFMAAYNHLRSSSGEIQLRAWLFAIARNRCYSVLRSRRAEPASEVQERATEGLAAYVERRQDLRDLVRDMRALPQDQRTALVLAELESMSHAEIAHVLGVPREKVKALVFQARESLVASREARETDCATIREQVATSGGGALRRVHIRRHLRECDGCREFRRRLERKQR